MKSAGENKKAISFTQLNAFLRCPRQYYFRYVLGLRTPPSGAMVQSRQTRPMKIPPKSRPVWTQVSLGFKPGMVWGPT
jgi:hypothetical protein